MTVNPIQQWPVIPFAIRTESQILEGDPQLLVRLRFHTRDVLTAADDQGIYRTVVAPHPDSSHLAMTLADFRALAQEIEALASDLAETE